LYPARLGEFRAGARLRRSARRLVSTTLCYACPGAALRRKQTEETMRAKEAGLPCAQLDLPRNAPLYWRL